MAELSRIEPLKIRGPYQTKYNKGWFDGRAWRFVEGHDFPKGEIEQFRARLRAAACRRKVAIVTMIADGNTVIMQAKEKLSTQTA